MVMMSEQNIPLEVPERVFQANQSWLPLLHNLQVGNDLVKILVPFASLVLAQGSCSIFQVSFIIINPRNEDYGNCMIGSGLAPFRK